jgi:hypothetical protein
VKVFGPIARVARFADLDDQVEACRRIFSSDTHWQARVRSRRRILPTCGAFVPARTHPCPRFPRLFQDGKEGVDGSSPSEGLKKNPAKWPWCVARNGEISVRRGYETGTFWD